MSKRRSTKAGKQNRRRSHTAGSRRWISMIVVAVLVVLGQGLFTSYAKNQAYIAQEQELMSQLEEEQERTLEIEEFKESSETDAYIEQVAREKLGMAYEDEIIFEAAQ